MQLEFYKFSKDQTAFLLKHLLDLRKHKSFQPTYITYCYGREQKEHIVTFLSANENALQYVVKKGTKKVAEYTLLSKDSQELENIIYLESILEKKGRPITNMIPEKLYVELSDLVLDASKL